MTIAIQHLPVQQAPLAESYVIRLGAMLSPFGSEPFDEKAFAGAILEWLRDYAPQEVHHLDLSVDDLSFCQNDFTIEMHAANLGTANVRRIEIKGKLAKSHPPLEDVNIRIELHQDPMQQKSILIEIPVPDRAILKADKQRLPSTVRAAQRLLSYIGRNFLLVRDEEILDPRFVKILMQDDTKLADESLVPRAVSLLTNPTRSLPVIITSSINKGPNEYEQATPEAIRETDDRYHKQDDGDLGDDAPERLFFGLAHCFLISHSVAVSIREKLKPGFRIAGDKEFTSVVIMPPTGDESIPKQSVITSVLARAHRNSEKYVISKNLSTILDAIDFLKPARQDELTVENMRFLSKLANILRQQNEGDSEPHTITRSALLRLLQTEEALLNSWQDTEAAMSLAMGNQGRVQELEAELTEKTELLRDLLARLAEAENRLSEATASTQALEEEVDRITVSTERDRNSIYPHFSLLRQWVEATCRVIDPGTGIKQTVVLSSRTDPARVLSQHEEKAFACLAILHTYRDLLPALAKGQAPPSIRGSFERACAAAGVSFGYSLSSRDQYDRYGEEYKVLDASGETVTLGYHFKCGGSGSKLFRLYVGLNSEGQCIVGPMGQDHLRYASGG